MASNNNIEALIGTWEHVRTENLDGFLKEVGVPMPIRMLAKRSSPRIIISEDNGTWTIRTETLIKNMTTRFTPGVEFQDTTPDGSEVQTTICFENGKWLQTVRDKKNKETKVTRSIDEQGLHQLTMTCGDVTAHRWFKRTE
ncbi:unnamed protein product [Rotaria socialis]|uniref:Uncharacterized protein n=1 Tax=Rotaria socialis TaxID=392032 RepID=A0A818BBY3_9BILA|nr:unnamed protein product [Rotaria socialis]CAF3342111.1 unnamed protein product [Rotaria socialis]CAF3363255.1 unnamed protein product [Rotaria socialis]CAF3410361.1 unnamed protein product [Rotaria socialis]CAF3416506.1 unnamed protein product [Rotaria socialis]